MESTKAVKEKDKKEPMTPKQRTIFILKIVGNVIFYGIIFALFLFSIMNINSGGKGGIPNIFGKGYLSVQSNSMSIEQRVLNKSNKLPEQYDKYTIKSFNQGDLLHVDMLSDDAKQNLKVGDVITFWSVKLNAYNTHRIVYIGYDSNGKIDLLCTQGDNSVINKQLVYSPLDKSEKMIELDQSGDVDTFNSDDLANIKAKTTSVSAGTGAFIDKIHEYWLFIFVIPIAIILIIEIVLVVKNIFDLRREKNKAIDLADHEAQMAELQNEKERMRQELLAELRAQGALPTEEAKQEAPAEKAEEPEATPIVEEKAPVEETPNEDTADPEKVEEVKEETTEETPVETNKEEEEPVVNDEALEPDMDIEENEEEK